MARELEPSEDAAASEDPVEQSGSDDVQESHESTETAESQTSTGSDARTETDPDADPDATVVITPEQMAAANDNSTR